MVSNRRSPGAAKALKPSTAALNLNAGRADRAKAFAAQREEQGKTAATELPIYFGVDLVTGRDKLITTLGPELPLDVFKPLLEMDIDLPALIMQVMQAIESAGGREALGEVVIATLYSNPNLPAELIEAVHQVGCRLLTEPGFEAFLAERPSGPDWRALGSGLMEWYGIDLGEFLGSSPSSTDGGTSEPTSLTTTQEPSSAESGGSPASLAG